MEQPGGELAELRAAMSYLSSEVAHTRQEFRTDIRRLDDRIFQLLLLQVGTLATALASLVAALVS
ncbi:MAG: hypothetical protein E6G03_13505 [Actinobacteria bacterium]|nr:MAG: hypothetical protein E6G03_13505 [Actinomycetota bacterium]